MSNVSEMPREDFVAQSTQHIMAEGMAAGEVSDLAARELEDADNSNIFSNQGLFPREELDVAHTTNGQLAENAFKARLLEVPHVAEVAEVHEGPGEQDEFNKYAQEHIDHDY